MIEDYTLLSGAEFDPELDEIEYGIVMLEGDLAAGYGEFAGPWWTAGMTLATKKNYERLLEKLKKAKSKGQSGRVKRLQRRLAAIKRKKGRQIKKRKGSGKELTKRQQKFLDARKSRKSKIKAARQKKRIAKARSAAIKRGWPSDLTITDKWLNDRKVKSKAFFIVAAYVTYTRAAIVMAKQGLSFIQAFRQVLPKIRKSSYRQEVSLALRPYLGKLTIAAKEYVAKEKGEEATTEDGTPIRRIRRILPPGVSAPPRLAPVYRTRPGLNMRSRLAALRAQRAQAAAAQVAAQRAAAARQAELMRQQQAAMAAQQQAQAAALARQRAALAAQLAAQRAAFRRRMQQTAAQERVIQSGAFQAFPHSSSISDDQEVEDTSLDMDMDMDEGDGFDEEGGGEDEEFSDDEFGEDEESTPFYQNPLVLIGAAAAAFFGYQQMQKKKKKGKKSKPGAPAAG
jgi:hypothetical protein